MDDTILSDESLASAILALHQQEMGMHPEIFQQNILAWLRTIINYDSAAWTFHGQEREMNYQTNVGIPADDIEEWNRYAEEDEFIPQMLKNAVNGGITLNTNDIPNIMQTKSFRHYHREYGLCQAVLTAQVNPENNSLHVICLNRHHATPLYTEGQRALLETLMPHIIIAWNNNSRLFLNQENINHNQISITIALMDKSGVLHQSNKDFETILQKEWPDWQGTKLPSQLCDWLTTIPINSNNIFKGKHIQLRLIPLNGLFLAHARENTLLDTLTEREYRIAKLFSTGMSYKEIARELNIAPSTVRNHLNKAYIRMGISSKIQLVQKFNSISE